MNTLTLEVHCSHRAETTLPWEMFQWNYWLQRKRYPGYDSASHTVYPHLNVGIYGAT